MIGDRLGASMSWRRVLFAGTVVLSCVLVAGRAQAQQIFLEIPGVAGESTVTGFVGQIDVLSMSFGGSKPCGGGSLSLSSVNLLKFTDKSSVDLALALKNSTVFPTATIRFTRSDNQVYQSYQLVDAVVESFQVSGGAGADPRTTEAVSFASAQVIVTYTYFDGGGKGSAPESMTFVSSSCP